MEWVETTGRTVAEALEAALDQLGVDEHDAEVVVLEEAKSALFGLRKSEARVRARVRPTRPRPKRQRDRRRARTGQEGGNPRRQGSSAARSGAEAGAGEVVAVGATVSTDGRADSAETSSATRSRRTRSKRRADGTSGSAVLTEAARDRSRDENGPTGGRMPSANGEDQMSVEEQAQLAQSFVGGVVERLGLPAATNVAVVDETTIEVSVEGAGLGLLIGPHGTTLRALQELTRTAVQRRSGEHGTRVVVDVAGYRAKRTAALVQFAKSVAQQVLETGLPHSLEPMSAADRKTVHDTVNDIDGVRTASEGEESTRHVVIYPTAGDEGGAKPAGPRAPDVAASTGDDTAVEDAEDPEGSEGSEDESEDDDSD